MSTKRHRSFPPPFRRTRSKDALYESKIRSFVNTNTYDGKTTVYPPAGHVTWTSKFHRDIMQDIVTPAYYSIVTKGGIVNNPSSREILDYSEIPGTITRVKTDQLSKGPSITTSTWTDYNICSLYGNAEVVSDGRYKIPSGIDNEVRRIATIKALANIDGPEAQLLEDFFEGGKALGTLRKPLQTMRPIHKKLKAGVRKYDDLTRDWQNAQSRGGAFKSNKLKYILSERARVVESLSTAWLSARFGYAQLAYTAMNLHEYWRYPDLIRAQKDRAGGRARARGVEERRISGKGPLVTQDGSSNKVYFEVSVNLYLKSKATVVYKRRTLDPAMGLTKDLGLRLKDLPRTAWNLIPVSWFADRFIDLSSSMQGFMNLHDPRLMVEYGSVSLEYKLEETIQVVGSSVGIPSYTFNASGGSSSRLIHTINRNPWSPSLSDLKPPVTLKSLDDVKQTLDETSLVLTKLSSIFRSHRIR